MLPVGFLVDLPAGVSGLDGYLHDRVHAEVLPQQQPMLWRADAFLDCWRSSKNAIVLLYACM